MSAEHTQALDGRHFAAALAVGIHRVINDQAFLNKINVFPVADGDTGTNLSLSLSGALGELQADTDQHLGTLLATIADRLLDGARGNSGAILAQFFQGVSDSAGEINRFTTYTFAKAVAMGSDYAHDAVSAPTEGTILSVIKRFSTSLQHQSTKEKTLDFKTLFSTSKVHVDEALAATPQQLDVLRKAGVVDAGAKGFAELVSGMADYICNGTVVSPADMASVKGLEPSQAYATSGETSSFRYCTECLVNGESIDRRKLREALDTLGDSLVLAGTKHKAKIHIHVDDPSRVFKLAEDFGEVSQQKADDMQQQQQSTQSGGQTFAVITDSAADLSDAELERLDIHIVPLRIQFGERGYLDKLSLSVGEFYAELQNNPAHPTTSQPAPGDLRRQFQFLASHFDEVVSINLSSQVSGTYDAARSAAARIDASGDVHVVNSRNASVGQGQLVVLAAECAAAGYDARRTLEVVELSASMIKTFAMLGKLHFAVRGGRVPSWVRSVANFLRLTPILATKPDGQVGLGGFLLGRRRRLSKFAAFVTSRSDVISCRHIRIGHAVCEKDAEILATLLQEKMPQAASLSICELGTAIGVHGGPGTLVVSTSPSVSADDLTIDDLTIDDLTIDVD